MAAKGPMVVNTHQGLEVKARRRLGEAGQFEALLEELATKLEDSNGSEKAANISDLDVSQNVLSHEQWEALFSQLGAHNTRVQRFRLFGCPTFNDEVMRVFTDYLRLLNSETAPTEMHLSDCAITTEGWMLLMDVVENTELYPYKVVPSGRNAPLYLRLENNYIAEESIKEKVETGVVRGFKKGSSGGQWQRPGPDGNIRVNLVMRSDNSFAQKTGEPPAPEDAPAPKQVFDKFEQQQAAQQNWVRQAPVAAAGAWGAPAYGAWTGKGGCMMGGAMGKGAAMGGAMAGWGGQQALPAGRQNVRPLAAGVVRPGQTRVNAPITPASNAGKGAAGQFNAFASKAQTATSAYGRAGGAADRSRTPAGRAQQPSAPPPKNKTSDLPHPWEEHWSDEYQIPYFWNAETGDSLWEKPTF